ncbi:MAG: DNA repair exonuclease [Nitrospiraceae bacterium]|nr:DNA repair exonuclease [Nitrospiraceae bacterium]
MAIRIIHTSDWQIGKVFRFLDPTIMGLLQEARLGAITRLGELAKENGVRHILVAGDVYDMEALTARSINQPLERMRPFKDIHWHLLPGNHDPHRPNGLWDRILSGGIPDNVHVHLIPKPVALADGGTVLLPAPLVHRHTLGDPTAYMDDNFPSSGRIRIGLSHGTVTGFGSEDRSVPNFISPDRPKTAALSYLALGDWHGQRKINARCWYSGTPEQDAFDVENAGKALLVAIEGPDMDPTVTPIETGYYTWTSLTRIVHSRDEIDSLERTLRGLPGDPSRTLLSLNIEGGLSLQDRVYFEKTIVEGVSAAFCVLRLESKHLYATPTPEDLDQIDRGGFVRVAAEKLRRLSEESGETGILASEALQRLYLEHMKLHGGQ